MPKANAAEAALWDGKKLRISADGTFKLYGLSTSGTWLEENGKLVLLPQRTFDQERGTPAYALFGKRLAITLEGKGLGSIDWIRTNDPYPVRWTRVARPSVARLIEMWDVDDVTDQNWADFDYAYDELMLGGPDVANELAYLHAHTKSFRRTISIQTFLAGRKRDPNLLALIDRLNDPRPRFARTAASSLIEASDPIVVEPLLEYVAHDPKSRWIALRAFGKIESEKPLQFLRREVASPSSVSNLETALASLARQKDMATVSAFERYAHSSSESVQIPAVAGLFRTDSTRVTTGMIARIVQIAWKGQTLPRWDAITLLGEMRQGQSTLVALLDDGDWIVRREAANGLARFGPVRNPVLRAKLKTLLFDDQAAVRNAAARTLRASSGG